MTAITFNADLVAAALVAAARRKGVPAAEAFEHRDARVLAAICLQALVSAPVATRVLRTKNPTLLAPSNWKRASIDREDVASVCKTLGLPPPWLVDRRGPRFKKAPLAADAGALLPVPPTVAAPLAEALPTRTGGGAEKPQPATPLIKANGREPGHGEHRLNAVRYLSKKGVAIEQRGTGEYQIGGNQVSEAHVVDLVNTHRREAGLRAITAMDLE